MHCGFFKRLDLDGKMWSPSASDATSSHCSCFMQTQMAQQFLLKMHSDKSSIGHVINPLQKIWVILCFNFISVFLSSQVTQGILISQIKNEFFEDILKIFLKIISNLVSLKQSSGEF